MKPTSLKKSKAYELHLRLTVEQFDFVDEQSDAFDMSMQDYVRLLIDSYRFNVCEVENAYSEADSDDQL